MKNTLRIMLLSLIVTMPVAAAQTASAAPAEPIAIKGAMLSDATGKRLAPVYNVDDDGSAEIMFDGRVVTVPASTLSMVNGELTTSLKKPEVGELP